MSVLKQRTLELMQANRLDEAKAVCAQACRAEPNDAEAWCLAGVIHGMLGELDESLACCQRAIAIRPNYAEAHNNMGRAFENQQQLDKAIACYREAIHLTPDYANAYYNLGNVLNSLGQPKEAVSCYNEAIRIRPDDAEAHVNLGVALAASGQFAEAVEAYREALKLQPNSADACNALGVALAQQGNRDEAIAAHREALRLDPAHVLAHNSLGNALADHGQHEEAVVHYHEALRLKPNYADAHYNLGTVLYAQGQSEKAILHYKHALRLKPDYVEAHYNLGLALAAQDRLDEAEASYRQALEILPEYTVTWNNLGIVLSLQGRLDEAISSYRKALTIRPDYATAHSNMLFAQLHLPDIALTRIIESHKEWAAVHTSRHRANWKKFDNDRDPEHRLVLGFCSGDFRRHPVGYFIIRVFESLRAENCDIVCYSTHTGCDDLTARFKATATKWHDAYHLSDDQLCELIRQDQIDILFDLTGHNAGNRLLAFTRKPAPLSITWAGYMATTGLDAIDYILADRFEIPKGAERFYVEKVIRMPDAFICYDPPEYAPEVSSLPALTNGYITFGCFNRLNKLNTEVITAWAEILRRGAGSKLILKTKELSCSHTRDRVASTFRQHGIDPSRVDFHGGSAHKQHMLAYNSIDIQLDTFPYTGSTTTLESLWMGVPVITLPNETFAGRHSLTFLSNIGLTEVIARDAGHYIDLAVGLASDFTRLTELRAGLRSQLAQSPVCDGPRFARSLMVELRTAWREWCCSAITAPASRSTSVSETDDKQRAGTSLERNQHVDTGES